MTDQEFQDIMKNLQAQGFANTMWNLQKAVIDAIADISATSQVSFLPTLRFFAENLNKTADLLEEKTHEIFDGMTEEEAEQYMRDHDDD